MAQIELPPGRIARALRLLRRSDVLLRIGMCLAAAVSVWLFTGGWSPPFGFRPGDVPSRNIDARIQFSQEDKQQTEVERERARQNVECVYDHDVRKLVDLRAALRDKMLQVQSAESYEKADPALLAELVASSRDEKAPLGDAQDQEQAKRALFEEIRAALAQETDSVEFANALERAMAEHERFGLLKSLQHQQDEGTMTAICVHRLSDDQYIRRVEIEEVRISEAAERLQGRLAEEEVLRPLAPFLAGWLGPQLPETLTLNRAETDAAADREAMTVQPVLRTYKVGDRLALGGSAVNEANLKLLMLEHEALTGSMGVMTKVIQIVADFGMYIALYTLCGFYISFRHPRLLSDARRLGSLLLLTIGTVALVWLGAGWRAELIPLLMFAMTIVIAYERELALLLAAAVSLLCVLSLGYGLVQFVIVTASMATAILLLGRIRSRTKLFYVGACTGAVTFLTTLGVGTLAGWPMGLALVKTALLFGVYSVLAGLLMTSLLPFVERLFDVQTEISLLELGDVAHPLLQELVRRAPGTYNHSINVASMAEAAAEAIDANGLLARVGAYFHDIGKMLKPAYFIENQGEELSRHETLMPAMSTLIIIAHVKDGADLARQHHLPQSMIDFILQHHGTTLVEFFYDRASKQCEQHPDQGEVDEGSYRYPGPKPQTKEAAVVMMADAVESAARTLVDPAPSRIDSLVHDIALKRLLDGQFDECGLTLKELRTIEDSLVKSLAAVYHGRVKYPEQQTA